MGREQERLGRGGRWRFKTVSALKKGALRSAPTRASRARARLLEFGVKFCGADCSGAVREAVRGRAARVP